MTEIETFGKTKINEFVIDFYRSSILLQIFAEFIFAKQGFFTILQNLFLWMNEFSSFFFELIFAKKCKIAKINSANISIATICLSKDFWP